MTLLFVHDHVPIARLILQRIQPVLGESVGLVSTFSHKKRSAGFFPPSQKRTFAKVEGLAPSPALPAPRGLGKKAIPMKALRLYGAGSLVALSPALAARKETKLPRRPSSPAADPYALGTSNEPKMWTVLFSRNTTNPHTQGTNATPGELLTRPSG
jgi:hypothetical protein